MEFVQEFFVNLEVKFRAFKITFGTVRRTFRLSTSTLGFFKISEVDAPTAGLRKVASFNDRGVSLEVWGS